MMVPPPVVFTHSDLRPRNIMVKDEVVTGIVDWEFVGWYPEYWGFSRVLNIWKWQKWLVGLPGHDSSAILLRVSSPFILDRDAMVIMMFSIDVRDMRRRLVAGKGLVSSY
jgi:thiamine kinase-like enzyme